MSETPSCAPSNESLVLPEQSRREYLQSMGIVSWLPKAEPWQAVVVNDYNEADDEKADDKTIINEAVIEKAVIEKITIDEITIEKTAIEKTVDEDSVRARENTDFVKGTYPAVNQFLKLINWSNQSILSESAKTLLVICRHKIDEPASSFSRANTPSQFMIDYINSITEISKSRGLDLNVQLAHLSQVGLTDDNISFNQGLEKTKPDLVLILGDETLNQFTKNGHDVSQFRGKSIALTETISACTSYHPYTLIQEPALKRLAFEDLYQLVDCLNG